MAEAHGDDGERYFEGLAGREPASAGSSALRDALMRESRAVAQAELDAQGKTLTQEDQVLVQRIRAQLAQHSAWPASQSAPRSAATPRPANGARSRRGLSAVLSGLGLRDAGMALAVCAVLAAGWWALRERAPSAAGIPAEYRYRGDGPYVIRDPDPEKRALALTDELRRLGNKGTTIQVAADAWVITLEPTPALTPAGRNAIASAIGLAKGTDPLPKELLVTVPAAAASAPAS